MAWEFDPCSCYRIEKSQLNRKQKGGSAGLSAAKKSSITLVRKNDNFGGGITRLFSMHSVIAVFAFAFQKKLNCMKIFENQRTANDNL